MSIQSSEEKVTVHCACGTKLKAPVAAVGRKAKCPKCGAELLIEAPKVQDDLEDGLYDLAHDANVAAATQPEEPISPPPAPPAAPPAAMTGGATAFPTTRTKVDVHQPKPEGSLVKGTIFSAICAFVGALVWFGIAKVTDHEIGWVAWGVGLAAGVGMAAGYKGQSVTAGSVAAAMSVGGIVLGKFMVFTIVILPLVNQMFGSLADKLSDEDVLHAHVEEELLREKGIEPVDATEEQAQSVTDEADRVIARMDATTRQDKTSEAREAMRTAGAGLVAEGNASMFFSTMFGGLDILFVVIAVATAFKVATFGNEAEGT